jgi:hypothetical protein
MTAWSVGVEGWVLQDAGQDVRRGDRTTFSVMFHPLELRVEPEPDRAARRIADANLYDVAGPIVYESAETLVLDCGLRLYLRRPDELADAAAVRGRGYLWMEAPGAFERDLGRQSFEEIEETDAMGADARRDRHGPDYVFDCRLLDEPPRPVR